MAKLIVQPATDKPNPNNTALAIKASKEWSTLAQEPVEVEQIRATLYAYGSELACLRLEHIMRHGRAGWSVPMQSWYWCNEVF